jgi:GH25 family lysozyme M1 (1,4-beta-N-acetylmuramidase)
MSDPFVIDLYQGDNVQDTPGPLGGFARVKAYNSGIAFLIHKASEGLAEVDSRYQARRAAWMNGVPVTVTDVNGEILQLVPRFAAYHFLHGQDPEGEARHFLTTAQLRPGDDAVVDWEEVGATGFQPSADAVDAFCNVVERALGFPIIVYSGNVAKEQLKGKDPRFAKRRLWLAQYSTHFTVQESWTSPWLWQNNGDQAGPGPNTIPGIDGFCDNSRIVPPMTIKRLNAEWGGGQERGLQASPEALQQLRQHVDSVLAVATAPAAALALTAPAGPVAAVAPQIAAEQDFCSLWPTAKPILQTVGGIVSLIPGVGAGAGPVLNSLVSVGDQIYSSTCKK